MASTHPETVNDEAASNSSVNESQVVNDVDSSTPKRAKLDEAGESSPIKRTGSASRNKRSDAVMIAEAKAAFGDLDTSEGRRLRKRSSEPAKVEEKKQTPRRSTSRRKGSTKTADKKEEEEEEETAEEAQPAEKIGSNGKPEDSSAAEADGVAEGKSEEEENAKPSVDKSGNSDDAEAKDSKESKSEDVGKESKGEQAAEDGDKEKPSEVKSASG